MAGRVRTRRVLRLRLRQQTKRLRCWPATQVALQRTKVDVTLAAAFPPVET
jgi:hypothetical protein